VPELFVLFFKAISALAILWIGANILVRGASALALRVGISELAVGLTVVAFGTSTPELVVSLYAALQGATDIAVGNVVGSNICNIALILGLSALIRPTVVQAKVFRLDAPLLVLASLILAVLLTTGGLSRGAGALLVAGMLGFTAATFWQARREAESLRQGSSERVRDRKGRIAVNILLIIAGLLGLAAGGQLFVGSAVSLANAFGVSQAVIGLTIVAIGTSLPELATSIVAAARGQGDIAVGNVVGSNLFNILGVLGVTALVQPVPRGEIAYLDLSVMFLLSVALLPIVRSGFVASRAEGAILLISYIGYVAWRVAA
jgi:cation:H+ antiporter